MKGGTDRATFNAGASGQGVEGSGQTDLGDRLQDSCTTGDRGFVLFPSLSP